MPRAGDMMVVAVALVVATGCGRRNFNVDAGATVDAAPPRECTTPPAGCQLVAQYECGGVCFAWCGNVTSQPGGAAICEAWGGCLATITNMPVNNCAASRLGSSRTTWIGARQSNAATSAAEGWAWCDGARVEFAAWKAGEPDNSGLDENGAENCAIIEGGGTWVDRPCDEGREVLCTRPL